MTVGVANNWANLGVTGRVDVEALSVAGNLVVGSNAPATADAPGVTGTIAWDADFIYVCVDTDLWVRAALVTW